MPYQHSTHDTRQESSEPIITIPIRLEPYYYTCLQEQAEANGVTPDEWLYEWLVERMEAANAPDALASFPLAPLRVRRKTIQLAVSPQVHERLEKIHRSLNQGLDPANYKTLGDMLAAGLMETLGSRALLAHELGYTYLYELDSALDMGTATVVPLFEGELHLVDDLAQLIQARRAHEAATRDSRAGRLTDVLARLHHGLLVAGRLRELSDFGPDEEEDPDQAVPLTGLMDLFGEPAITTLADPTTAYGRYEPLSVAQAAILMEAWSLAQQVAGGMSDLGIPVIDRSFRARLDSLAEIGAIHLVTAPSPTIYRIDWLGDWYETVHEIAAAPESLEESGLPQALLDLAETILHEGSSATEEQAAHNVAAATAALLVAVETSQFCQADYTLGGAFFWLAQVLLSSGEYNEAETYADRLSELVEQGQIESDMEIVAQSYLLRGTIALHVDRLEEAQQLLQQALEQAERHGYPHVAIEALEELGTLAFRENRFDEGSLLFEKALAIAVKSPGQAGSIHMSWAFDLADYGDVPGAQQHYQAAFALLQEEGNDTLLRQLVQHLGYLQEGEILPMPSSEDRRD